MVGVVNDCSVKYLKAIMSFSLSQLIVKLLLTHTANVFIPKIGYTVKLK